MRSKIRPPEEVVEVRRKAGKLRKITTASGRSYLLLDEPSSVRFLEEGSVLEPEDLERLEGPLAQAAGFVFSCNLLSRRERSEFEVRAALVDEGLENPETIDYIVDALKAKNYLSDERFAGEMIRYLVGTRGAGPGMVKGRLRQAGVPDDIIDARIRATFTEGVERAAARRIARARLAGRRGNEPLKTAAKMKGFLMRRGYAWGVIKEIYNGILSGELTGDDDEQ